MVVKDSAAQEAPEPAVAAETANPVVDPAPASEPAPAPEVKPAAAEPKDAPAPAAEKKPAADDPYASLALAEGSALGAPDVAAVKELAAKYKMPIEAAQELLAREESRQETALGAFEGAVTEYKSALTKVYGDKLDSEEKYVDAFLDRFAGPGSKADGLKKILEDTGLRHYPKLWEALREVGKAISEPSKVVGGRSQKDAVPLDDDARWKKNWPNSGERPSKLVGLARTS